MTEAALALCEQKKQNMGELLARVKAENEEQRDHQSRARKKDQEVQKNGRSHNSTTNLILIYIASWFI